MRQCATTYDPAVSLDASDFDGILAVSMGVGKYSGYYAVPLPVPNCFGEGRRAALIIPCGAGAEHDGH